MKRAERLEWIRRRVREMARSGEYGGWREIEAAMRQGGIYEADSDLDFKGDPGEIDRICELAQAARREGVAYEEMIRQRKATSDPSVRGQITGG